ncbi:MULTISPECIES: hypothetical protein [unclassified Streptomyces]
MRTAPHPRVRADRVTAREAAHCEVPMERTDALRAAGLPVVWELP